MNRTQFTTKLKDNWPKISPSVLDSVENKLSFYSENDINEIWTQLHETYNQVSAPTYAHIINVIKANNIHQTLGKSIKRNYIYECNKCNTIYRDTTNDVIAICCPNCLSESRTLKEYDGNVHHNVVMYQYKCFRITEKYNNKPFKCIMFNQSGCYGSNCKSWGIQKNTHHCNDCICEECCSKLIAENRAWRTREQNKSLEDRPGSKYPV